MGKHVLLVEPDSDLVKVLIKRIERLADVEVHSLFETARRRLGECPFDFIVTNVRLGDHTGLELVRLSLASGDPARSLVYTDTHDPLVGRQIQTAGAFYETRTCSPYAVAPFLAGRLPEE